LVALVLAAVAIAAAVWLGLVVQRTLRREIGGDPAVARSALRRIADGDLSGTEVAAHDVDSLMGALTAMQRSMSQLVTQVRQATDSIGTASVEIATGNQDLSRRTEQTASNLEETAASMEE